MTNSHNHFNQDNPLASDLVNPLISELGEDSVLINIENSDSAYGDLISKDSDELSLIEKAIEAQKQNDYEQSVFNNSSAKFTLNFGNYGNNYSHQGSPYTGDRNEQHTVNQNAILNQADDFGEEIVAQGTGLTGEYFNEANLTNPILTRTDTNIDFDWKKGSPDSAIAKDTFSVRWTGQIEATQDETYTFYTQADDGVRLWVNNQLIIDDWKQHSLSERSGIIDLEAGQFYDIKLEYFENKGDAAVSLLWSSPTQNKEIIPTSFLYPEDYTPPAPPKVESEPTTLQLGTKNNNSFSIMAEGQVRVNGSSDFDGDPGDKRDDALIYAGQGFTFNGNIVLPVQRDEAGNAITDADNKEILVDRAVAVSENYLQLNANNSSNRYSGLIPPQIVDLLIVEVPEYSTLKSENLASAIPDDGSIINFDIRSNRMNNLNQWQQKFPAPGTAENPTVVRITGEGLNIPSNVDLSNYVIIVEQGGINFNGSGHNLYNVVLVAENGNINLGNVKAHNSNIFASNTINMNGGARFSGKSLIANGQGNITFDGATATTGESDFLTVISTGNITFNGSSDTRGEFLTAKDFTFNGHSTLYGSIGAKKNITFNGNGTVIGISTPDVNPTPEITIDDITVVEGDMGTKIAQFNVTLSNPSNVAVTVDYGTEDVTAIAGEDYGATSGTITFAPGETSQIIQVPIIGDSLDELDKEFLVNLSNPSNANIVDDLGKGTIEDNDDAPALSISSELVTEGDTGIKQAEFTVMLDHPSGKEITIDFNTTDGTALAGIDYTAIAGTLTFAPGEISKTITVDVLGDNLDEVDEAFSIQLANPNNVTLDNNLATGTIIDNDLPPSITIENISVTEGDGGTSNATITINLNRPSSLPIRVDYATANDTAIVGSDYEALSGTVDFAPGETSKTIEIAIAGDTIDEFDETLAINLTNASNATIGTNAGTVTILNDDESSIVVINDITVTEGTNGTSTAIFTVSLDNPSSKEITLDYATADGTAIAGEDYIATNGTVTFAPGESTKAIAVTIIGDNLDEIDEAFTLNFTNPSNVTISNNQGTVTITDEDDAPEVTLTDISVTEADSGSTTATVTVTLSTPSSLPITVDYATADGTAIAGEDYIAQNGMIAFAPGETTKTIKVEIIGDILDEIDEAFIVNFSNASNVTVPDPETVVTIVDNDLPSEMSIDDVTIAEGDNGNTTATFTVSLNTPSSKEITIDYSTEDGTALAGEDYTAIAGTLTFAPGETSKTIEVEVIGDSLDELNEAFDLNLSNISNATPDSFTAVGTIADDDLPPQISIDSVTVEEGDTNPVNTVFTVSLNAPSNLPITVEYSTADGTALAEADGDYLAVNGTITFNPGEISKNIVVPVLGDLINENDETFTVNLANPTNAIFASNKGTGTIEDNDNSPELAISDAVVTEGDDGTTIASFTVNLSEAAASSVSVDYATTDGDAVAGDDYTATNGTLTFAPGETSKTIEVEVIGDTADEVDEIFTVNLSNVSSTIEVLIEDGSAQGKIVDNDSLINEPEGILLAEGSDFEVEYIQPLTIPSASSVVTISYSDLNFDTTDPNSINDALEFALVDNNGKSLIHTIGTEQNAFFNLTEGEAANLAPGVSLDGEIIKVNLTDVTAGTTANLIVRLVNNDGDINTSVRIDTISIESGDQTIPVSIADNVVTVNTPNVVDFTGLKDVTPSINTQYQQTSFNQKTQTLTANLALQNKGTYWLDTPLLVTVTNISDPTVRVVNADGITPEGLSYYDFSNLVAGDKFAPGASSQATEIAFYNPNGVQFTYELAVLSELNAAPEITSQPDLEIIGGQSYNYQVEAEDTDDDALGYRLLAAPGNMSIDETTGLISWQTTTDDISNHAVVVEVSDGRGGVDLQTFNLAVIATPANRPPQFTSTPVVDAYINQPYNYDANAIDPDLDPINYEVISGPEGLTINPKTGEVEWTPPSVVVLGDTVIGQIGLPGEKDEFSFSGSKGQQIYFDPLQYSGGYQYWNFDVYAPDGSKIVDTDLSYQNNQLVKLPETGNYRVVVSTNSSQTGSYGFSVIDLNLTPVAPLDTVIKGKLSPGSEDDLYRFAGNKGQRIFIDKISNSGSVDWVLYSPQNSVVTSNSSMGDIEVVLTSDGEYKIALRGQAGFTNTVDYSFEIITPDEITAPMELGSIDSPKSVYGDITEKGERDVYIFDGVVGQRILFDRLFYNSTQYYSHSINIISPSGQSVWNQNFYNANETTPLILSESGLYQVYIDASGEDTGTYSFNLLDIDLATVIDLDTKYENTLDPGQETHIYQFGGTESQRLFIDSLNNVSGSWRVYDSSFKVVGSAVLGGNIELVLAKSDTYYLSIAGNSNNPVDYKFELITPDIVTEAIEWNTEISRTITEKGEQDIFTFEGAKEQRLFIDSLTNNSTNLRFTLISPSGIQLYSNVQLNGDSSRRPITLAEAGTYQITVDGLDETTEDYNFRLLDVDEAISISPETNIAGTIEPGRAIQFYQFSGSAGERVYFDSQTISSSNTVWYLYDANNQILSGQNLRTDWEYVLPADGNYYLMLRGEDNTPVEYDFQIVKTVDNPIPLNLNQQIDGEISKLGEQNTYTFTGNLGQTLYLDGRGNGSQISVKVITPNGTLLHNGNGSGDSAPLTLLEDGTYQVIVDGVSDTVGDYSFALADEADELSFATAYDGVLKARETVLYSFEGTAGQKLNFQSLAVNSNASWILYAPVTLPSNGKVVGSTSINVDFNKVLPVDGIYLLALRNNSDIAVDFNFQVEDISDTPVISSGLNTIYEGTVDASETVDSYEVVANAGDLIYVDGQLGYDYYKGVRLYNPDGSAIFSDNYTQNIARVIQLQQTGTYNLEAYGSSNNYRFGLIDLKAAPNLDTNTPTEISLATRETKAFQFTGSVGQQLWFDSQSATNSSYNLRIFNASGRQVGTAGRDVGLVTLEADGQYYAVIEYSGTTDSTINFQLLDAANATPVELDTEITGTSGVSGYETQVYRFNGDAGQRIYIDERASITSGAYYLYDTAGKLVNSNTLNYSHEYYELVTGGNYTLVVSPNYANNNYTINLVSSEVAVSDYIVGDTVTAEIAKPGNENVYNFEGTFGQQLWFDSLATSSINAALYAPSGKRVWSQSSGSDKDLTNLDETGTYRLVLDGSYKTVGAYSFRILDIADAAMTTDLDTVISGGFGDSTRETQIYRFTGNEGQPIYLDRTVGYYYNSYSIYDTNGTRISSKGFSEDLETFELPKDGEYLLVLEGRGYSGNNNNYSLEIVTPEITTTPYTLGTVIETEISEAGEKDYYTFEGAKGQKLLFDNLGTASNTSFQLFAPSGRNVLNGTLNNTDYWNNLDETGTYTLVVDGSGDTTNSYSFRLSDYQQIATGINLDTVITGDFGTSQRETDVYAFEGNEGQYLYFDRTQGHSYNYWRIYDEQNNLVQSKQLSSDIEFALPHTGQYALHLSGYGNSDSEYSFQIVTPELNTTIYTVGETVVSNIGEAGEKDTYTFAGESGQTLLFDSLEYASNINWQVLSPSGSSVFNNTNISSDRTHVLSETGIYTLTVDGANDAVGNYGFRILDWSSAIPIDLNTTIYGNFGEGRESDIYQFTATRDTHLFFDSKSVITQIAGLYTMIEVN
ncbi:MAG: hypothetical protein HC764_10810 [Pleurocapsa sp. CRU_1_2]|nr:hypothetical protein [Pleurocapsa sp. CRU_1_2]